MNKRKEKQNRFSFALQNFDSFSRFDNQFYAVEDTVVANSDFLFMRLSNGKIYKKIVVFIEEVAVAL